jgi:hypothetical protein
LKDYGSRFCYSVLLSSINVKFFLEYFVEFRKWKYHATLAAVMENYEDLLVIALPQFGQAETVRVEFLTVRDLAVMASG